jgi:hypothetical protein
LKLGRGAHDEELLTLLAETFGLRFPPGTRFPYQPAAGAA